MYYLATRGYGLAFFYSPNPATVIECLPSCAGPHDPPQYAPAIYRDLILEFYRANYFHQRSDAGDRPDTT